ncbi:MAG TPA: methylated-DNA--[protein]-cysteine S-methyltransferase [Nitrospiria bacterium]|jgi:methylated-DNA-[protein]-cysteine S-methyltransferase
MNPIYYFDFSSPVGQIVLYGTPESLSKIKIFPHSRKSIFSADEKKFSLQKRSDLFKIWLDWFENYFEGKVQPVKGPIQFSVGTPFQQKVWKTLLKIPFGQVKSYKWMAEKTGSPQAVRAVGQANGKNPFPILIPCHRVIYNNGYLGGYTGGLGIKRQLLEVEGWSVQNHRVVKKLPLSFPLSPPHHSRNL